MDERSDQPDSAGASAGGETVATNAPERAEAASLSLEERQKRLLDAVRADSGERVRGELAAGTRADSHLPHGDKGLCPALYVAATHGCLNAAMALLEGVADVAQCTPKGSSALHEAAHMGNAAFIRLLLDAGAEVEAKNHPGTTPLMLAVQAGHVDASRLLIAAGASPNQPPTGNTLLHSAAFRGFSEVAELLLDVGAAVDTIVELHATPLSCAAAGGGPAEISVLLRHGANVNHQDMFGYSPLISSIVSRKGDNVKTLLDAGADPHLRCRAGHTAFHCCIGISCAEAFDLLLPLQPDVDVRTEPGFDPAMGRPTHSSGETPLMLACMAGQRGFVKALLKRGASRTARDVKDNTALHVCASSGQLGCMLLILGKPGRYHLTPEQVDAKDMIGGTPLHRCAADGNLQCCAALVAAGASIHALAVTGSTPYELASLFYSANQPLMELLSGAAPAHEQSPAGVVCDACGAGPPPGGLKACGSCFSVVYCGAACSAAHWEKHKAECRRRMKVQQGKVKVVGSASDVPAASFFPPQ